MGNFSRELSNSLNCPLILSCLTFEDFSLILIRIFSVPPSQADLSGHGVLLDLLLSDRLRNGSAGQAELQRWKFTE